MVACSDDGHDPSGDIPAETLVAVRVQPRARADAVLGEREGVIAIRLKAPPVDGQANAALLAFIAQRLGVPQRRVTLVRGATSRQKWIQVDGFSAASVRAMLLA
jgi:uncharacterized protein (TIGR00251 family)